MFVHIHGHSYYSLLDGIWSTKSIVSKAKNLWMGAIWLTDYNAIYGTYEFYNLCKKSEINPILGIDINYTQNINDQILVDESYIVVIAKDYEWYKNLMKISTLASTIWLYEKPRIDSTIIKDNREWIIILLSSGNRSWLYNMFQKNAGDDKIIDQIRLLEDNIWPENIYIEIVAQDYKKEKTLEYTNKRAIELAKKLNKKLIINNDFHYVDKEDKEAFEVALCIKDGKQLSASDRRVILGDYHIQSEDEIVKAMIDNGFESEYIYDIIKNNDDLAKSINVSFPNSEYHFPTYAANDEISSLYNEFVTK